MQSNVELREMRSYYDDLYQRHRERTNGAAPAGHYDRNPLWQRYTAALRALVEKHGLRNKRVLEIGSGLGLLQDFVPDYIGIDIARSAAYYTQKPFATASATALPFATDSFDAIWSIWTLEHIPDPEAMLREIERVLKPGGLLFLCAAWEVEQDVPEGLLARPLRELSWRDRRRKVLAKLRTHRLARQVRLFGARGFRLLRSALRLDSGKLDYQPITPNLETYWESDADACTAIDNHSVWLWLRRHGHRSLETNSALGSLFLRHSRPLRFRMKS